MEDPRAKLTKEQKQKKALGNLARNEKVPVMPPTLGNTLSMAFRDCGGIEAMMDLCLYCCDESDEAARMYYIWKETTLDDRTKLIPEQMCKAADISPAKLLGTLAAAAFQRNIDLSKLMMSINGPKVIAATEKYALKVNGHQDRKMLLQAAGVVPTGGKGMAININNANVQANSDESSGMPDFAEEAILITSE